MSGELSTKMSGWLSHVRAASEQGVTIAAYAAAQGLSATSMYQAKSQLMKVGAWPRSPRAKVTGTSQRLRKRSHFVAVEMSPPMGCRLSHVSGWSIECSALPPVAWLNSLLSGAAHAT